MNHLTHLLVLTAEPHLRGAVQLYGEIPINELRAKRAEVVRSAFRTPSGLWWRVLGFNGTSTPGNTFRLAIGVDRSTIGSTGSPFKPFAPGSPLYVVGCQMSYRSHTSDCSSESIGQSIANKRLTSALKALQESAAKSGTKLDRVGVLIKPGPRHWVLSLTLPRARTEAAP